MQLEEQNLKLCFTQFVRYMSLVAFVDNERILLYLELGRQHEHEINEKVTFKEIVQILLDQGIVPNLINEQVIKSALQTFVEKGSAPKVRVAVGVKATPSSDGFLTLMVRSIEPILTCKITSGVNRFFENVSEGQEIARIYLPKSGKSGMSVFGEELRSSIGKPSKTVIGSSLSKITHDEKGYESIVASTKGLLLQEGEKLQISDTLKISGDVDSQIGPIDFCGKVIIDGGVLKGGHLLAHDSIEIRGGLADAVIASQGSIKIKAPAFGSQVFKISPEDTLELPDLIDVSAGGDVALDIAQGLACRAKGNIEVRREVRDCFIITGQSIKIPEGVIRRSIVVTGGSILVKELGSDDGGYVIIHYESHGKISGELYEIEKSLRELERILVKLDLFLGPLAKDKQKLSRLTGEIKDKVKTFIENRIKVLNSIADLSTRRDSFLSQAAENGGEKFEVIITSILYSGVHFKSDKFTLNITEDQRGPLKVQYSGESGFNIVR